MVAEIVIQSHAINPPPIVRRATQSVAEWASAHGHKYTCIGDTLFDFAPDWAIKAAHGRLQMAADVARLGWIRHLLDAGHTRVIWLDADVLVFRADHFVLDAPDGYVFGREHWAQANAEGGFALRKNVHNAVLVFSPAGRTTLDFYFETACRLLRTAGPRVPPQFVGPKLLTALHNVVQFPLTDTVGMASPLVLAALAAGGGAVWDALTSAHGDALAALNLCTSLRDGTHDGVVVTDQLYADAADFLLAGEGV